MSIIFILVAIPFVFLLYIGYLLCNLYVFNRHPKNVFLEPNYQQENPIQSKKFNKNPFKKEKLADHYDAIIIGSGISGLSSGALLSKAGKRVLVLEKHNVIGGCLHTFNIQGKDKEFQFCAGLHYLGKMTGPEGELLDFLCDKKIEMISLDENYDNLSIINTETNEKLLDLEIPQGQDALIKKLKQVFPEESKAIDEYCEISFPPNYEIIPVIILKCFPFIFSKLFKYVVAPKFMKYVHTSVSQALDKLTSNSLLKCVICYIGIDYGSNPKKAPLYEHSMIHNIFKNGGQIPKGGADDIVESLVKVIRKGGGDVMSKANITCVHIDKKGKCAGVCILKDKESIIIESPIVISTAGVYNTYSKLIPRPLREKLGYKQLKYVPSYSVQTTFLGFDETLEELGLKLQNYFIMTSSDFDGQFTRYMESDGNLDPKNGIDIPILIANLRPYNNKVSMTVLSFANHQWFHEWDHHRVGQRSVDYEDLKERIANRALELLYMKLPQLANRHSVMNTSSPVTFNHYLSNNFGDYLGYKRVVGNDDLVFRWGRPISNLENLYLAGQDIFAGGVQGAMLSSLITCGCILRRNLFADLAEAVEKR